MEQMDSYSMKEIIEAITKPSCTRTEPRDGFFVFKKYNYEFRCLFVQRPEYFKQFNASNGWGMYENGIPRISRGGRIKDGEKQE